MNEVNFCHWLKGYFDLSNQVHDLNPVQTHIIRYRLDEVFNDEIPVEPCHDRGTQAPLSIWPRDPDAIGPENSPDVETVNYVGTDPFTTTCGCIQTEDGSIGLCSEHRAILNFDISGDV